MLQLLVFNASMYLLGVYLCCTLIVNFHMFAVSSPSAVGSTTNKKHNSRAHFAPRRVGEIFGGGGCSKKPVYWEPGKG